MIFLYERKPGGIPRPIVPVRLVHGTNFVATEALIDSGADCTFFDLEVAHLLGINLRNSSACTITGIAGDIQPAFLQQVELRVGNVTYVLEAGFTNLGQGFVAVLGQVGFFDRFIVTFNQKEGTISIDPHTRRLPLRAYR